MISLTLTHTAEYALRAMTQLALAPAGASVGAGELSEKTGVPVHYLSKIMRRMVAAGLVDSAKGHGGGFRISKPLGSISYLDILEVAGYETEKSDCVFGWGACRSDKPCPMHHSWTTLNEGFVAWARSTTLAAVKRQERINILTAGPDTKRRGPK